MSKTANMDHIISIVRVTDELQLLVGLAARAPAPYYDELSKRVDALGAAVRGVLASYMARDAALAASLDDLHANVAYLAFDLEATRRERDMLRDKLTNG